MRKNFRAEFVAIAPEFFQRSHDTLAAETDKLPLLPELLADLGWPPLPMDDF